MYQKALTLAILHPEENMHELGCMCVFLVLYLSLPYTISMHGRNELITRQNVENKYT